MNKVKILSIENSTHDVVYLKTEKPEGLTFLPGQAVDISINKPSWKNELRPFTFTSLPMDEFLEFHIKIYSDHNGVTKQIQNLITNDSLYIGDVFGDIEYKGEGIFIAGGAGITPFISILKDLKSKGEIKKNKLIFANKTADDIIEPALLHQLLGDNFINVLSEEKRSGFEHGFLTKKLIESQIETPNTYFYLCGPPPMMDAVLEQFSELGIQESYIVKEQF